LYRGGRVGARGFQASAGQVRLGHAPSIALVGRIANGSAQDVGMDGLDELRPGGTLLEGRQGPCECKELKNVMMGRIPLRRAGSDVTQATGRIESLPDPIGEELLCGDAGWQVPEVGGDLVDHPVIKRPFSCAWHIQVPQDEGKGGRTFGQLIPANFGRGVVEIASVPSFDLPALRVNGIGPDGKSRSGGGIHPLEGCNLGTIGMVLAGWF